MEAECASCCSSLDAICEESEMIALLQSLFWGSSDIDPSLCSSSNSFSLSSSSHFSFIGSESYGTTALVNAATDVAFDHQDDTPVSSNETNIGSKRKIQTDEQKDRHNEVCVALSPRKAGNSALQCNKSRARKQSRKNYAKRSERINERMRILQELFPNGTKVDSSTMLEESVQYVKFLHLQIKLLSSDEMWIYAPLAYEGVNIRLHLNS